MSCYLGSKDTPITDCTVTQINLPVLTVEVRTYRAEGPTEPVFVSMDVGTAKIAVSGQGAGVWNEKLLRELYDNWKEEYNGRHD